MATLSPYIVKSVSASSIGSTGTFTKSPNGHGRLSLLSSDIEEDLGIIDLDDPRFDYLSGDEVFLLEDGEEYDPNVHSYAAAREWIESYPKRFENDTYFDVKQSNIQVATPLNGYNRFEYLTKSVSRTATITKRKIDTNHSPTTTTSMATPPAAAGQRYGTITKGTIGQANRTYEVLGSNLRFTPTTESPATGERTYIINQANTPTTTTVDNGDGSRRYPVNTNTITKTNRRVLNVTLPNRCDSFESDSNCNVNTDQEEFGTLSSSDGITDNNDLSRPINRTFDIQNNVDSDDTASSTSTQPSCRNYPTISRNVTRTVLQRESSQGRNMKNGSNTIRRSPQRSAYLASSNDDLLGSDCSTMSMRSNLSMTSSITGKSEPNLIDAQNTCLSVHQPRLVGSVQKKFQSRLVAPTANHVFTGTALSLIGRPSSQNGLNAKRIPTVIPTSANQPAASSIANHSFVPGGGAGSKARSIGNMNTLQQQQQQPGSSSQQFGMPRAASQIEMRQDYENSSSSNNNLPQIVGNGGGGEDEIKPPLAHQKLAMLASGNGGLDRKSTFRVHRPSTVVNVATLFAESQGGGPMLATTANRNYVASSAPTAETMINQTLSNGDAATNDPSKFCFAARTNVSRMKNATTSNNFFVNNSNGGGYNDRNNNVKNHLHHPDDDDEDNNNHHHNHGGLGNSVFTANNSTTNNNHNNSPNKQINPTISSSRIPAFLPKLSMTSIPQARSSIPVSGKDPASHRPGLVRPGTVNGTAASPTPRRSMAAAYIGNHHQHHLDNLSNKYQ